MSSKKCLMHYLRETDETLHEPSCILSCNQEGYKQCFKNLRLTYWWFQHFFFKPLCPLTLHFPFLHWWISKWDWVGKSKNRLRITNKLFGPNSWRQVQDWWEAQWGFPPESQLYDQRWLLYQANLSISSSLNGLICEVGMKKLEKPLQSL